MNPPEICETCGHHREIPGETRTAARGGEISIPCGSGCVELLIRVNPRWTCARWCAAEGA